MWVSRLDWCSHLLWRRCASGSGLLRFLYIVAAWIFSRRESTGLHSITRLGDSGNKKTQISTVPCNLALLPRELTQRVPDHDTPQRPYSSTGGVAYLV